MSLCIAVNNPGNYVIIAGDGRTMRGDEIVSNRHLKLTRLTEHISIFISGVQDYCEILRSRIGQRVHVWTSVEVVASIVQEESRKLHDQLLEKYPTFYEVSEGAALLATVVTFYDTQSNESGFIEYCHTDDFIPHFSKGSEMTARGLKQEVVKEYLPSHFNPSDPLQSVLGAFNYIESLDSRVGGTGCIHVISKAGTNQYVLEMRS